MATLAHDLLAWYDQHARDLPWRAKAPQKANPYHVWLSEIMLQQTTVPAVKGYFLAFTQRWPTLSALANAEDEAILAAWAGLGYYARARNLICTARLITHEMAGNFPTDESALKALPGIGDYTAAAIAAIAFGQRAVVVDSNVERIISRIAVIKTTLPAGKKEIKAATDRATPNKRAGDFAQAMMDLGSSLCSPKTPDCPACPIAKHCKAHAEGIAETLPIKAPKKARPTRRAVAYWLVVDDHVMIERRQDKGLLGGMAGLPTSPWLEQSKSAALAARSPYDGDWQTLNGTVKHSFTHFHLEVTVRRIILLQRPVSNHRWVPLSQVLDHGLPTVFKKMAHHALQHSA